MIGSKNHFFKQSKEALLYKRAFVNSLLEIKGYSVEQTNIYLKVYDYFSLNPKDFDGATLVKDLCDMPDLDLDAMLHDYHYLVCNVGVNVALKSKADFLYAKGNERKGKGIYSAYSRFLGLTITSIGFIPFARIKRGRITEAQRNEFLSDYNTLLRQN